MKPYITENIPRVRIKELPAYIQEFQEYMESVRRLTPQTVRLYISRLKVLHNWLLKSQSFHDRFNGTWDEVSLMPIIHLEKEDIISFYQSQYDRVGSNTRKAYKSAYDVFMIFAEHEYGATPVPLSAFQYVGYSKKNTKDEDKTVPILTNGDVEAILGAVRKLGSTWSALRNTLILRTIIESGGRVSEILSLPKSAFTTEHPDYDFAVILPNFKTIQHRYKERYVPISKELYHSVREFTEMNEVQSNLAFPSVSGQILTQALVWNEIITPIIQETGIEGLGPHLFRHYRITQWCKEATSPYAVAEIATKAGTTPGNIMKSYLHAE